MPKTDTEARPARQRPGRTEVCLPATTKAIYAAHAASRGMDLSGWILSALADQLATETSKQAHSAFRAEFDRELAKIETARANLEKRVAAIEEGEE